LFVDLYVTIMATKLTLRLDERLIRKAKTYAQRQGKSVSQLVAEFFARLGQPPEAENDELSPTVRRLQGLIREKGVDEETYRRHVEKKHR
jgi:hypothetical protein